MTPSYPAFPGMHSNGMTMRDWLAGMVVGAVYTHGTAFNGGSINPDTVAKIAYDIADAMVERSKW